ncbi:MAG: hypothetical protein H8F28_24510 [Fibrella sp.]|nr:hypothetical protein [Armatimonadota bacterium]
MQDNVLNTEDAAALLRVSPKIVSELFESGELQGFDLGGEKLTTRSAINVLVESKMKQSLLVKNETQVFTGSVETVIQVCLPTLAQIKSAVWQQVAPVTYIARNGKEIDWQDNAFAHTFAIGGKQIPIVVSVFGPKGPTFKPGYPHWGAEVYLGEVKHGLRSIVEWVRVDDFDESGVLASVIKNDDGATMVRIDQPLPDGYDQLKTDIYNRVITRQYAKHRRCVVAHETERESLVLHALLRCRQKGWI